MTDNSSSNDLSTQQRIQKSLEEAERGEVDDFDLDAAIKELDDSEQFPAEIPVDESILDELTRQACFAADMAAIDHMDDISSVPTPNGGPQSLTKAEQMRIGVRAAIRNLLANGLIVAKSHDEMNVIFAKGMTMR